MATSEINIAIQKISESVTNEENDYATLEHWFRVLRNYCASGRHAQNKVANNFMILVSAKNVATHLLANKKNDLCLLLCLQFLANYLVDNKQNQCKIWDSFSDVINKALNYNELKVQNCAAMILYNILLDNEKILSDLDDPLFCIINATQNNATNEYATFILELMVCKSSYIEKHFCKLPDNCKLIILNACDAILKSQNRRLFPVEVLPIYLSYFIKLSTSTLANIGPNFASTNGFEILLIIRLLDVINSLASYQTVYLLQLQENSELLIKGVELLKAVHLLSKQKGSCFAMLNKMSDLEEVVENGRAVEEENTFGFKAALVRLVGILSYNNVTMQDTARELGAIPLILDCCNIDARNPLIIQWAVLAMRNLCQGNIRNQQIVACIDRTGQLDLSRLEQVDSMNK